MRRFASGCCGCFILVTVMVDRGGHEGSGLRRLAEVVFSAFCEGTICILVFGLSADGGGSRLARPTGLADGGRGDIVR